MDLKKLELQYAQLGRELGRSTWSADEFVELSAARQRIADRLAAWDRLRQLANPPNPITAVDTHAAFWWRASKSGSTG